MVKVYDNKGAYDAMRSRTHYRPLYIAKHTDEWYASVLGDRTEMRACRDCRQIKHVSMFTKKRLDPSGFRRECRACANAAKRQQPSGVSTAVRWEVWERDDFRCRHCGARRFLEVDHITPRAKGGSDEPDNLQTLCRTCNRTKGFTES